MISSQYKVSISYNLSLNQRMVVMAAQHAIGWLHSFWVGFNQELCFVHFISALKRLKEKKIKSKTAPGNMCKVLDLLLMIVSS